MYQDSNKEQGEEDLIGGLEKAATADMPTAEIGSLQTCTYPGIAQAIFLLLMLFGIQILIGIPMAIAGLLGNPLSVAIHNSVSVAIVVGYGFKKTGALFHEVFPLNRISLLLLMGLLLAVLGLFILAGEINGLLVWMLPPPEGFSKFMYEVAGGGQSKWQSFIATLIVAPFAEEFFFRGLILHGFLKRYSVNKAIIGSALLFALMHGNPWQFVTGVGLGILSVFR